MRPFFEKFEEIASRETRVITLPHPMHGLPADSYALVELYCDEVDCDCRQVIIQVWKSDKPGVSLATFNFGWESVQFTEPFMKPRLDKIDDAVLTLLDLTSFTEGKGDFAYARAWKGHDWGVLKRLHEEGFIGDPVSKAKSVVLTKEGQARARELFEKLFCGSDTPSQL